MKQKVTMPSYMKQFSCIAGDCEETCCAGWYIAIDEATYKKYKKVKHPEMKKRFEKELVAKKGSSSECAAKIKLKNNRCAFLAKDNLCDIYKTLGESYLSETCTMYPRNTNLLGSKLELSLALSCPEAARKVLLNREGIYFIEEEMESLPVVGASLKLQPNQPKHFEDYLMQMRTLLIAIWQESSYNIHDKWQAFEYVMLRFQEFKQRHDLKKLAQFLSEMKNQGYLKKELKKEQTKNLIAYYTQEEIAKKLLECLVNMRNSKKWPSAIYEGCYEEMIEGLGQILDHQKYQKGVKIYEKVVYETYPYILENYFINYIYERVVPINQKTPLESLEEIALYLALIRLHLVGIAAKNEELIPTNIVTCIQGFTRVFDHNELYMKQIKKQLVGK